MQLNIIKCEAKKFYGKDVPVTAVAAHACVLLLHDAAHRTNWFYGLWTKAQEFITRIKEIEIILCV